MQLILMPFNFHVFIFYMFNNEILYFLIQFLVYLNHNRYLKLKLCLLEEVLIFLNKSFSLVEFLALHKKLEFFQFFVVFFSRKKMKNLQLLVVFLSRKKMKNLQFFVVFLLRKKCRIWRKMIIFSGAFHRSAPNFKFVFQDAD
jgi:hypothetical protein